MEITLTDIVERLRTLERRDGPDCIWGEAATVIEQLRATVNAQAAAVEHTDRLLVTCKQHLANTKHEINRLRADLREAGVLR